MRNDAIRCRQKRSQKGPAGQAHRAGPAQPHPHADILSIDTSQAAGLPGVHAIVTPFDAPKGWVAPDMPLLDTRVRFAGDEVAAVAAEDAETARRALDLMRVEYRVLPFVLDAEEALRPEATPIHPEGNLARRS